MSDIDFEKDLEIDIENLEVEATLQPELFFKYSRLAKEARENFDMLKMRLSVTESELAQKARIRPRAFGLQKVTEASIREAVQTHPKYITIYKKMIKAKSYADLLNRAQEAMDQRKRMLELLVQLHGREYFAGPNVPHTPDQFWKQIKERREEKIHEKMIKKSRKRKRGSRE